MEDEPRHPFRPVRLRTRICPPRAAWWVGFAGGLFAALSALSAMPAFADVIDVPYTHILSGFGEPSGPYVGGTFTALAGPALDATVYVAPTVDPGGVDFRILITETTFTNGFHPTNVLYESQTFSAPLGAGRIPAPYTVNLGSLPLQAGVTYAIILDAFIGFNGMFSSAPVGINFYNAYPGGVHVSYIGGPFPGGTREQHFASAWLVQENIDFAFTMHFGPPIPGDLNDDGLLTDADIDLWYVLRPDLNGDGHADQADIDYLVNALFDTHYGDANLDHVVDITDLATVATWFGGPGGWAHGDFNGSGDVTITDLAMLATYFGLEGGAAMSAESSAVPEPAMMGLALLAAATARTRRRGARCAT